MGPIKAFLEQGKIEKLMMYTNGQDRTFEYLQENETQNLGTISDQKENFYKKFQCCHKTKRTWDIWFDEVNRVQVVSLDGISTWMCKEDFKSDSWYL